MRVQIRASVRGQCVSVGGALALAAFIAACGGSGNDDQSSSSATVTTGTTADEGSQSGSASETAATSGSGAGSADSSSGGRDLGPCGAYIECVQGAGEPVTPAIGMYGEDGTCWEQFDEAACFADCTALRDQLHEAHPDIPECGDCGALESSCENGETCCKGSTCSEDYVLDVTVCRPSCLVGADCESCCCYGDQSMPGEGACWDDWCAGDVSQCTQACGFVGSLCATDADCCGDSVCVADCDIPARCHVPCDSQEDCGSICCLQGACRDCSTFPCG